MSKYPFVACLHVFYCGLVAIYLLVLLITVAVCRNVRVRSPRTRDAIVNVLTVLFSLMFAFLLVEGYVRFTSNDSDPIGLTLMGKHWMVRYGGPENSLGYRDDEHPIDRLSSKRVCFVLGDSFAQGQGVRDYRDTFPLLLGRSLGDAWEVVSLAECGANADNYYTSLTRYPFQHPSAIVLSHFVNDFDCGNSIIVGAFRDLTGAETPGTVTSLLTNTFYTCSIVYWRTIIPRLTTTYWKSLFAAYEDPQKWRDYEQRLALFITYAKEHHSRLVVLVFPLLHDIQSSRVATQKVVRFFQARGIETIDLAEALKGYSPRELCATQSDLHPSEKCHAIAARLLQEQLESGQAPLDK